MVGWCETWGHLMTHVHFHPHHNVSKKASFCELLQSMCLRLPSCHLPESRWLLRGIPLLVPWLFPPNLSRHPPKLSLCVKSSCDSRIVPPSPPTIFFVCDISGGSMIVPSNLNPFQMAVSMISASQMMWDPVGVGWGQWTLTQQTARCAPPCCSSNAAP